MRNGKTDGLDLQGMLGGPGVSRRSFLKGVAAAGAAASLAGAGTATAAASVARRPALAPGTMVEAEDCAEAIIQIYMANGVKYIFINGGTDTGPITEAVVKLSALGYPAPQLINSIHEHFGMSAAHGYYMVTGVPQVVQVHVELGTQQVGGALHNAFRGRAGIVLAAGRSPYTTDGEMPGSRSSGIHFIQEIRDQGEIVRQYTKWDYELARSENVNHVVQRAFQVAATEPAGPVYLVLPREVLVEKIGGVNLLPVEQFGPVASPAADPDALRRATELLVKAENPAIVTQYSGRNPETVAELVRVAELMAIPVYDRRVRVNFPTTNTMGLGSSPGTSLRDFDVLLVIDEDVPYIPAGIRPSAEAKIIQIDIDPLKAATPVWGFPADISMVADSRTALADLFVAAEARITSGDRARYAERREKVTAAHMAMRARLDERAMGLATSNPVRGEWLGKILNEVLTPDMLVCTETVTAGGPALPYIDRSLPGSWFQSGGSSLGWGMDAAFGAKLAAPDKTVVALEADGSFVFAHPIAVLWAADVYKVPFLTVIFNNQGYGAVKNAWLDLYPQGYARRLNTFPGADIDPPADYAAIARACRAYGERVTDPGSLKAALLRGLEAVKGGQAAVIDVIMPKI